MTRDKVPIAGILTEVENKDIELEKLVLDEENPRIGYWIDNIARIANEEPTQEDLEKVLKMGQYDDYIRLKMSIETNEGLMKEIWVFPYKNGKYKIIDGNTRLLIYKDLRDKYPHKKTYKKIRCRILPTDISDKQKDFVRLIAHLRGENDWQAYDRARMLYILYHEKGYTNEELKNKTKLSISEIKKWRESYKNMTEQFLPRFFDKPDPFSKFSYFVEYENEKIKNGMKRHNLTIQNFCDWIGNNEIARAQDVRDLKKILKNKEIATVLKEDGFEAAKYELSIVEPAYSSRFFEYVEKCISGFKNMTREEERVILAGEEPKKKEMIINLYDEVSSLVDMIKRFNS